MIISSVNGSVIILEIGVDEKIILMKNSIIIHNLNLICLRYSLSVTNLVSINELEDIKTYTQISHQTKSEFIRSAIRDKIRFLQEQSKNESLEPHKETPENKLSLEELKRIRDILERLEKKER